MVLRLHVGCTLQLCSTTLLTPMLLGTLAAWAFGLDYLKRGPKSESVRGVGLSKRKRGPQSVRVRQDGFSARDRRSPSCVAGAPARWALHWVWDMGAVRRSVSI